VEIQFYDVKSRNGTNLTKFVSRDDWERIDAPEE
jgi:hypothetical protein